MTMWHHIIAASLVAASYSCLCSFQTQASAGSGAKAAKADASFIIGERRTDLTKAAAQARGAVWEAWLGSQAQVIRVEFRGKEGQRLIVDIHVLPHGPILLTCAEPCSAWKLKQEQEAVIERRSTSDEPMAEGQHLPATAYRIVFLDGSRRVVFSL
jgi:hypothetical protein